MVVSLGARFVAYDPAGARRGELPYPLAANVLDVFNDIGSGSIDYLADARHSAFLDGMCEVALEVNDGSGNGTTWVEPGARLLKLKRGSSQVDETNTRRFTLQSYGFQLGKMRMLREEQLNENGERLFESMTVGAIVKTLFDEAHSRGNVSSFAYDFTATHDSAGQAWGGMVPPVSQRYGDSLLDLLRQFAENGICDWRVVGRTLKVYKPDGLGVDRAASVRLANGLDVVEAPDDEDATELAGRIAVQGDDGRTYEAVSPSAGSFGLWEEVVNASGVKDIGGLQFIGEAEQRRRSAPRVQMTRKLRTHGVVYLPFFAYNVGDTITAPDDSGALSPLRVRELQVALAADGLTVNATLNDRILERDIKDRRNWQGMLGGASSSVGGTGSPSGPNDDKRKPGVPTGLVVTSVHQFTPEGAPFSVIDAVFTPVSNGVDGKPIAIEKHELWVRKNVAGEPWRLLTESSGMGARITFSPMTANEALQFALRAVSRTGVPGDFSTAVNVTTARDTTPPPQPAPFSTPQTRLGQIVLPWSGRDKDGVVQPVDWSHGLVWMATSSAGAGTMIGRVGGAESFVVPMQPYNETRWFWLTSVDTSGNMSSPSTRVSAATAPLVNTDLIGEVISGANIVDGSITASEKIVGESITGALIEALSIEAGHLKANAVTADKVAAGAITGVAIAGDTITGDKIKARTIAANRVLIGSQGNLVIDAACDAPIGESWHVNQSSWAVVDVGGAWRRTLCNSRSVQSVANIVNRGTFDAQPGETFFVRVGMHAGEWAGAGLPYLHITWLTVDGTTPSAGGHYFLNADLAKAWHTYTGVAVAPAGAVRGVLSFEIQSNSTGNAYFGIPLITRQASAELIVDGGITADKIAANAITAGKIAADAITGKTITGGTITGTEISGVTVKASDSLRLKLGSSIAFEADNGSGFPTTIRGENTGVVVNGRITASSATLGLSFTTATANMHSPSNASQVARSSSMRKLKLDREPIPADYRILDLPPMTWRDRGEVEADPGTTKRVAGFVAEDLATLTAFSDNAFDALLVADDDGRVTSINYDRVPAYLVPLIKDMHERLTAAEDRLAELTA